MEQEHTAQMEKSTRNSGISLIPGLSNTTTFLLFEENTYLLLPIALLMILELCAPRLQSHQQFGAIRNAKDSHHRLS